MHRGRPILQTVHRSAPGPMRRIRPTTARGIEAGSSDDYSALDRVAGTFTTHGAGSPNDAPALRSTGIWRGFGKPAASELCTDWSNTSLARLCPYWCSCGHGSRCMQTGAVLLRAILCGRAGDWRIGSWIHRNTEALSTRVQGIHQNAPSRTLIPAKAVRLIERSEPELSHTGIRTRGRYKSRIAAR